MAEDVKTEELSPQDWSRIADFVVEEYQRRRSNRKDLEGMWKEIDRQIAMDPRVREIASGEKADWFPDLELPLQFNALEVIMADVRSLIFPAGESWYSVSADLSDDYRERFVKTRERYPLIRGGGFDNLKAGELSRFVNQIDLDQESADVLIKVVLDHYHRLYDFRSRFDLFATEQVKYGTGALRVRPTLSAKFAHDFRGVRAEEMRGPAIIPASIKDVYLDDTPAFAMHEGVALAPTTIRSFWKSLVDIKLAAKTGGTERGWIMGQLNKLELPSKAHDQVELLEIEGDLVIPKSQGSLFLPNVVVTVAKSDKSRPVRLLTNSQPFHSWVIGHYMRDEINSPYGASPLMKGQPIQEAATEVVNDMLGTAALNGRPPLLYDRNDSTLAAQGGPSLFPGAQIGTDSPNAVEIPELPETTPLFQVFVGLVKLYEDLTGVNDPRRGAPGRSHTTATQAELETNRGIARTDDFVSSLEGGALTTVLYMEYEILKSMMKRVQPIPVNTGGIEGWLNISASDLPDMASFTVHGSSGVIQKRERDQLFNQAIALTLQIAPVAAQMGSPIDVKFLQIIEEAYERAGIQNPGKFVAAASGGIQGGVAGEPAVPATNGGIPPELAAALSAAGAGG